MPVTVLHGDCLAVLPTLDAESVDAVVCDPPAGIGFMNREWDKDKGGRDQWIAWLASVMRECYRVMKPGAHALVWALPRTSHWTGMALEDAGFEVRDRITHLFGSGFPKSLDVSKALDKRGGADIGWFGPWLRQERERRGITAKALCAAIGAHGEVNHGGAVTNWEKGYNIPTADQFNALCDVLGLPFTRIEEAEREVIARGYRIRRESTVNVAGPSDGEYPITAPASAAAKQWAGWGTALKPAAEDWWLARKPLSGTVAQTVAAHGTGALNIDGCRIGTSKDVPASVSERRTVFSPMCGRDPESGGMDPNVGRWPANVCLSHSPECRQVGTRRVRGGTAVNRNRQPEIPNEVYGKGWKHSGRDEGYTDADGMETVPAWECHEFCPVRLLDEQSGERKSGQPGTMRPGENRGAAYGAESRPPGTPMTGYGDTGGASRFFYCAKSSRRERSEGLGDLKATHPTVKPLALMDWLIKLVTPPGGLVLDPFCGSGSTGCSAVRQGFRFLGIERESEYVAIAERRIAHWAKQASPQTELEVA